MSSCGLKNISHADELPIEWKTLLNQEEQAELAGWCKGIGSPVLMQAPSDSLTDEPLDSLSIVSWNLHVGGGEVSQFIDDLREGRLSGKPVNHFVLLFQEVFRTDSSIPATAPPDARSGAYIRKKPPSGERLDIIEIARRHQLNLFYVPSIRNGRQRRSTSPEDRGNAILSTLPLSSLLAIELPYERQRRVAISTTVSGKTSGGTPWELQFVNVHLDNRSRWHRVFDSFGNARRRQTTALMEAVLANTPTVLGGDFNTWFREDKEPAIEFLQQFFDEPEHALPHGTIAPGFGLPERTIDYLFFRLPESWERGYVRLESRYGSDHYPLLGRVHFGDKKNPSPLVGGVRGGGADCTEF